MLLDCPECGHGVSERAVACPSCGFPVAEHVAERKRAEADEADRGTREVVGQVDCVHCEARGFRSFEFEVDGEVREGFEWCSICEHTGRVVLCRSTSGYYAVDERHLEAFLAGGDPLDASAVIALGHEAPAGHRYPQPSKRMKR
jgi:hypothetical protein